MNYVLITESKVYIKPSLNGIKSAAQAEITESEFKQIGDVKVANISENDLKVLIDAKKFMEIPAHKLFKKESNSLYLLPLYFMIIILLVQGCVK